MPSPRTPTPRARSLWHDAVWSLVGEGAYAAGLLVTLVLLARLGSVEALGQYTLGLAIATPAILLTNLHLRPAFVVDDGRWGYDQYLSLRLSTIPLALLVMAGVVLVGGYDGRTAAMVLAVGGLRAWESLSDILLAPAQRAQHMGAVGRSRALRGILTATGLGVGLALTSDALVGMAVALLLLGGLSLGHDVTAARRFSPLSLRRPSPALLGLARRTLPIGLAAALLAASANTLAYILEHTHDVATLGQLGAVISVMYAGQVLNVALGNAAIPRLAARRRVGRGPLLRLLGGLLLLVAALGGLMILGVAVVGEPFLRVIYGDAYASLAPELVLAAAVAGVAGLANMLSQTLTAMGRFTQQLAINVAALAVSVTAAIWLVPGGGLRGAMWALLILAAVRLAIYGGVLFASLFGSNKQEIDDGHAREDMRCHPRPRSRPTPARVSLPARG